MALRRPSGAVIRIYHDPTRGRARRLKRCQALGFLRYNAALGESQALVHEHWQSADEIARWLDALPVEANSGDIYARLA